MFSEKVLVKGTFSEPASIDIPAGEVVVSASHAYATPGIYFAVLRAISHRQGENKAAYVRVQNLARVRVVVS